MLSEKLVGFLKRRVYNARTDWHKTGFNFLVDCKNILDVGCGKGLFAGLAPDKIVGLDWNWHSLKECANKGYTTIRGDTLSLPFADQSFEGAYCADLIEHFSPGDARNILVETLRILKAGGLLVIGTPLPSKMFWNDPSHVRPYSPHSLLGAVMLL